jgi:hypothetical protein
VQKSGKKDIKEVAKEGDLCDTCDAVGLRPAILCSRPHASSGSKEYPTPDTVRM